MKIFLGRMPEQRRDRVESHWHEEPESRRGRRARSEMPWEDWGGDETESRRRRTRGEMHEDWEEPESRRHGDWDEPESRMHGDWEEPESRRGRRPRSEMDVREEPESRRGRTRSHWDEEPDSRRRPRACEEEHYFPEQALPRIGYAASHEMPEASMGGGVAHLMEQGKAAVKKIDPALVGVLEDAVKVLQSPPQTWPAYLHRKDYAGIVDMEAKELLNAIKEKKPVSDMRKELTHTIAALFKLAASS